MANPNCPEGGGFTGSFVDKYDDVVAKHNEVVQLYTDTQLREWEAQAAKMTAESFAAADIGEFVKVYTSNGDGTFKEETVNKYSAHHWGNQLDITQGNIADVATVEDLAGIDTNVTLTAIVRDRRRGGIFYYDDTKANINNKGTIINGWCRQFDGVCNAIYFISDLENMDQTVQDLENMFAHTNYYSYYIPHEVNYGSDIAHNVTIFNKLNIPNRDLVVIDDSKDNGYSGVGHQGGQSRIYLNSSEANDGQHNSFMYILSEHHPGVMYKIAGSGIDSSGVLSRNATTFFQTLKTNYTWGIGMGGNSVTVDDVNNVTDEEELEASGFKIVASGLRGRIGLANIHNISLRTGNVGWFSGVNPDFKYTFCFNDDDINKDFVLKSSSSEYARIINMSASGYWYTEYSNKEMMIVSPLNKRLEFLGTDNEVRLLIRGGKLTTLYMLNDSYKIFEMNLDSAGTVTVGTSVGDMFKFREDGCFSAHQGISGGTCTTAGRPEASLCENGTMMFDTDLGKPIWLPNNSSNTWVDANGNEV